MNIRKQVPRDCHEVSHFKVLLHLLIPEVVTLEEKQRSVEVKEINLSVKELWI
jgi:hypothetical protein